MIRIRGLGEHTFSETLKAMIDSGLEPPICSVLIGSNDKVVVVVMFDDTDGKKLMDTDPGEKLDLPIKLCFSNEAGTVRRGTIYSKEDSLPDVVH